MADRAQERTKLGKYRESLVISNSSWPAFRVRENKHAEIRYINPKTKYENVFIPPILVQANNTNAGFLFALLKLFQWHT